MGTFNLSSMSPTIKAKDQAIGVFTEKDKFSTFQFDGV